MHKIKNILTNQYYILTIITALAFCIRLINIDKFFGLWYDETLTYFFSSQSFPFGILKALSREDFHMPLYYLYVSGWMKLFGTSDAILRLSSVIWGVLTVPAFFFLGKTYKSKNLGYTLAIISCLSPILIYYSQEFRFYSMLVFFAVLSITFFLKLLESPQKKDFIIFGLANLVILYIYTMGIIFVAAEFFVLLIHFYFYKEEYFKTFLKQGTVFLLLAIPYLIILSSYIHASSKCFVDAFCWGKSGWHTVFFLVTDWFSPLLSGMFTQDPRFLNNFFKFNQNTLMIIPSICFVAGLAYSCCNTNKKHIYLIFISSVFLLVETYLCTQDNFILMTKYTLVILPILFLISIDGLLSIPFKYIKIFFLGLILTSFIYNTINYKHSPSFSNRIGGFGYPALSIEKIGDNKKNYFIYQDGSKLFSKYLKNINLIDFNIPEILYLDKIKKEHRNFFSQDLISTTNKNNSYKTLIPYFLDPKPSKETRNYFNAVINEIPKGGKLIILTTAGEPATYKSIEKDVKDYQNGKIKEDDYKNMQAGLIYRKLNVDMMIIINNCTSLKKIREFKDGPVYVWKFIIYQKL